MKVIFTFGGLPHYLISILNRLNRIPGYEIKVIIPEGKGKTLGKGVHESRNNVEFGIIPLQERTAWYGKLYFKNFIHTIRSENPDILVINWPYVLAFLLLPSWRRLYRQRRFKLLYRDIPFNLPPYEQAIDFYRNRLENENGELINKHWGLKKVIYYSLLRRLIKSYLQKVDAHLYYTGDALDIIPTYGVNRDRIFITYNSPDTDQLFNVREALEKNPAAISKDKKVILHVGRLVAWKKVDLLIEAFREVYERHPDSELWIIGDGPESGNLRDLAKRTGLEDHIKFPGAVYDPLENGKYFLQASVYVLAGMGGLSINEAMAFGKPVICSRADGTEKKLVRDGINGYFFREDDLKDLAEKIHMLFSEPGKIVEFGKESTRIIREEVNVHTVVNAYKKAFDFILGETVTEN